MNNFIHPLDRSSTDKILKLDVIKNFFDEMHEDELDAVSAYVYSSSLPEIVDEDLMEMTRVACKKFGVDSVKIYLKRSYDFDVECAGYNEPIIILPDVLLERNDREIIQARLFAAAGAIAANHHKLGFIVWVAETLGGVANFPLVRQIADGLLYEWSRARKFTHDRAILSATGDLPLTLRNILYGVVPFDVLDNFQFGGEDDSFREQLERYRRNDNPAQMLGKAFSFFSDYAWLPRRYEEVLKFYRKGGVANANSI